MSIDTEESEESILSFDHEAVFIDAVKDPDDTKKKLTGVLSKISRKNTIIISKNGDIIEEALNSVAPKLSPRDSIDPSYSNLQIPYRIVCRQRLQSSRNRIRNEIHNEIRHFEMYQTKALDGVRIHRVFGDPKIHMDKREILKLTGKQKRRLEALLASP